jgi:hypothetical protein
MASLRNTALNLHRLAGADNIAEACRTTAFSPTAASLSSQAIESAVHKRASQQRRNPALSARHLSGLRPCGPRRDRTAGIDSTISCNSVLSWVLAAKTSTTKAVPRASEHMKLRVGLASVDRTWPGQRAPFSPETGRVQDRRRPANNDFNTLPLSGAGCLPLRCVKPHFNARSA